MWVLTVLLLGACQECPSFRDMEVQDPDGLGNNAQRQTLREAIRDIADWTGMDGACVPAIEITRKSEDRAVGLYRGPGANIHISPNAQDFYHVGTHELCHAVDREMGWSSDHKDLFPYEEEQNTDMYPTEVKRRREVFASACQLGPDEIAADDALAMDCGLSSSVSGRQRFLQEQVFAGAQRLSLDDRIPLTMDERLLPELLPEDSKVIAIDSDGRDLWILAYDDRCNWREPCRVPVGVTVTERPFTVTWLVRVDPVSGEFERMALPELSGWLLRPWSLLTDDGVIVGYSQDDDIESWHLDVATGSMDRSDGLSELLEGLDVRPGVLDASEAVIADGVLYSNGDVDGDATIQAHDIDNGMPLDLDLDRAHWGRKIYVTSMQAVDGRALLLSNDEGLSWLDARTGTWEMSPVPRWWWLFEPRQVGDDLVLAWILSYHKLFGQRVLPIAFLPSEGRWYLPEDACSAAREGMPSALEAQGRIWILGRQQHAEEGSSQWALTELVVGEP